MRLLAKVPLNEEETKRLMIHETAEGVYLFGFSQLADGGSKWDEWHETLDEAKEAGWEGYQVPPEAWTLVADPCEHCQQDWIQPVRVKGRNLDRPEWGKLERLVNGHWVDFTPDKEEK